MLLYSDEKIVLIHLIYGLEFVLIQSTIDRIFCIRQILQKKWEYNEEVHQLFIDFKKAYDSVTREVL
jgi:hypothetical protein